MADSDTTRVLSIVTRRSLITGTMTAAIMSLAPRSLAAEAPPTGDLTLSLWREWQAAHAVAIMLCREQQRLETQLADTIGFPCAVAEIPGAKAPRKVFSLAELDDFFTAVPRGSPLRIKAEAELLDHQARWHEADECLGYSAVKRAESQADEQARLLAEALRAAPANSLAGVAGKLDAVLALGEPAEDCEDFPWPQIRSARDDLIRIGRCMTPGLVFPGS
jgi:hypothetical protein